MRVYTRANKWNGKKMEKHGRARKGDFQRVTPSDCSLPTPGPLVLLGNSLWDTAIDFAIYRAKGTARSYICARVHLLVSNCIFNFSIFHTVLYLSRPSSFRFSLREGLALEQRSTHGVGFVNFSTTGVEL